MHEMQSRSGISSRDTGRLRSTGRDVAAWPADWNTERKRYITYAILAVGLVFMFMFVLCVIVRMHTLNRTQEIESARAAQQRGNVENQEMGFSAGDRPYPREHGTVRGRRRQGLRRPGRTGKPGRGDGRAGFHTNQRQMNVEDDYRDSDDNEWNSRNVEHHQRQHRERHQYKSKRRRYIDENSDRNNPEYGRSRWAREDDADRPVYRGDDRDEVTRNHVETMHVKNHQPDHKSGVFTSSISFNLDFKMGRSDYIDAVYPEEGNLPHFDFYNPPPYKCCCSIGLSIETLVPRENKADGASAQSAGTDAQLERDPNDPAAAAADDQPQQRVAESQNYEKRTETLKHYMCANNRSIFFFGIHSQRFSLRLHARKLMKKIAPKSTVNPTHVSMACILKYN